VKHSVFGYRGLARASRDDAILRSVRQPAQARVGVFGIGLAAYWPQFEGLRARLELNQHGIEARLGERGADVVSAGLIDTAEGARAAGELFARERVQLVLLYTATYATSSQVLPAVQAAKVPVVILNLQPTRSVDYERMTTAEWLASDSACCVSELAGVFTRARTPYRTVTGTLLEGDPAWDTIGDWIAATAAVQSLRAARFGFLGHTYPGMLDMYSDFTQVHAQTGAHVEVLEIDDLVARVDAADAESVARKGEEIRTVFELADRGVDPIADEITPEVFDWSARVAVGLDRLVDDFGLDGLTYYYRGVDGNENERVGAGLIVGNSLLTARGIPASGEGDLKTNVAMLLLDRLGAGGSYTEFYALDFDEGFVMMGHDGPGHLAIADGRPVARALKLYHGKAGAGLSIEMKVRLGPVTILGLSQTADGRLKLIAAEGESIPGPTFRIGNTNSRIRFAQPPAAFMDAWCAEGPTHHVALGIGHQLSRIRKVAWLLGLELAVVD
jgi:L-arabinose isomerase